MEMLMMFLDAIVPRFLVRSRMVRFAVALLMVASMSDMASAQQAPLSKRMADTVIERWPEGHFAPAGAPWHWNYELGTLLEGMDAVWYASANGEYFRYIKRSVDQFVGADGSISTYDASENSLDNILLGRQLLLLYGVTQDKRYYKAAVALRQQLAQQPKNASGGFWHKKIYPNQMWLDGLYMAEPFYAEYAAEFQEPQDFAEITRQFALIDQHARDARTGLLYHGWEETKQQPWANRETGASPTFWARGVGWYLMALVDTLPRYPENDPGRAELLAILQRTAAAVARYQDSESGLWYQVLDKPGAQGNYFESSAACMFTYALAKGARLGYLPRAYEQNAERGWRGIQTHFVQTAADGSVTLTGTVKAIGLGGAEHRDGSYAYYVSSPVVNNDPKGVGAFLLAASEMEVAPTVTAGLGETVVLDAWYNSQTRQNAAGQTEMFHYKWTDFANSGFSLFGHIWRSYGVATKTLTTAPTVEELRGAQFYVIASPDNPSKNPNPHYMTAEDAEQVAQWVRGGGVLLMMENDPDNADIPHMDLLADKFGLHFNNVLVHHVINDNFAMGRIDLPVASPPFTRSHVLYMKDTSSLTLSGDAVPLLRYQGDLLMAFAHYGKGMVFAVTDPWLYNEYTDGRKLPAEYDDFAGGVELVHWLLDQRAHVH
jgi:unsaturated rhamnogalacturonyl hydrolase